MDKKDKLSAVLTRLARLETADIAARNAIVADLRRIGAEYEKATFLGGWGKLAEKVKEPSMRRRPSSAGKLKELARRR